MAVDANDLCEYDEMIASAHLGLSTRGNLEMIRQQLRLEIMLCHAGHDDDQIPALEERIAEVDRRLASLPAHAREV
jgi:hypothetical protein